MVLLISTSISHQLNSYDRGRPQGRRNEENYTLVIRKSQVDSTQNPKISPLNFEPLLTRDPGAR